LPVPEDNSDEPPIALAFREGVTKMRLLAEIAKWTNGRNDLMAEIKKSAITRE